MSKLDHDKAFLIKDIRNLLQINGKNTNFLDLDDLDMKELWSIHTRELDAGIEAYYKEYRDK